MRQIGLRDAGDELIWRRAVETGAIIATKDEDFRARRAGIAAVPQVLWIRFGNVANQRLFSRLAPLWLDAEALLSAGEAIVELV